VDDLIEGLIRMMNSPEGFTGPVNIGTPWEFTILQLAETLIQMTGSASRIIFKPLPQDDPIQRRPDITLAREKLGWEPRIQLSEGLEKTIAYFRTMIG
jgi:UDP-glucuronate decarboxylase